MIFWRNSNLQPNRLSYFDYITIPSHCVACLELVFDETESPVWLADCMAEEASPVRRTSLLYIVSSKTPSSCLQTMIAIQCKSTYPSLTMITIHRYNRLEKTLRKILGAQYLAKGVAIILALQGSFFLSSFIT
jgi:hypothetical protein